MVRFVLSAAALVSLAATSSAFQAPSSTFASRAAARKSFAPLGAVLVDETVRNGLFQQKEDKPLVMPDLTGIALSGLKGKALTLQHEDFPTAIEVRRVIPEDCFQVETAKSLGYLSVSLVGTTLCTLFGLAATSVLNPANPLTWPFWAAYSVVTGTVAMGLWVLAHEVGPLFLSLFIYLVSDTPLLHQVYLINSLPSFDY